MWELIKDLADLGGLVHGLLPGVVKEGLHSGGKCGGVAYAHLDLLPAVDAGFGSCIAVAANEIHSCESDSSIQPAGYLHHHGRPSAGGRSGG